MKTFLKHAGLIVLTIVITVSVLNVLGKELVIKNSEAKYRDFYTEENDFDILFMGTSHVIDGIFPMEIWDDFGYTSYNFGGHSTPIATQYWVLKNALRYTSPKMVVIDCYSLMDDIKVSDNFDYAHISMDCFPISLTKIEATKDIMEGQEEHTMLDLLWPFSIYHNRWNELTQYDFDIEYNEQKGANRLIGVAEPELQEKIDSSYKLDHTTVAMEYLVKMVAECKERGIEVLLVYVPFPAKDYRQQEANTAYDLANECGVNYINFLDLNVVDYYTDMQDPDAHLNPSGGNKVSHYIGQYIYDNYELSDHRNEPGYEAWNERFDDYFNDKKDDFVYTVEPYEYLMLITDRDIRVELEIYNTRICEDELCMRFLNNMGCDTGNVVGRPEKFDENVDALLTIYYAKNDDVIERALLTYDGSLSVNKYYE